MVTVSNSTVDVEVDASVAYRHWAQFESFPSFIAGVESVTERGTFHHWVMKVGGALREFDTHLTDQIPNRLIAWRSVGGDVEGHTCRVTFEELSHGHSRVAIEFGWDPEGLDEEAGAALAFDQDVADATTRDFKRFVESSVH